MPKETHTNSTRAFKLLHQFFLCSLILIGPFLFVTPTTTRAAFIPKGIIHAFSIAVDSPKKAQVQVRTDDDDFDAPPAPVHEKKHHVKKHSFLAWFAFWCGIAGVACVAAPTALVLFMYLFGLTAGVTGANGIKKYRHAKLLKTLCYIGLILGAIAVVLATIPILLLL